MRLQAFLFPLLVVSILAAANAKKITPDECKGTNTTFLLSQIVCIDVVTGISEKLSEEDKKDVVSIENKITSYCKQKTLSAEQKKIVCI